MNPRPGGGGVTRRFLSRFGRGIVANLPYELEGVKREGDYSQRISQFIEIWKGRYKDEVVALKVFKVSPQDPQISAFKMVSMPRNPRRRFTLRYSDV